MKTQSSRRVIAPALLALASFNLPPASVFAQGTLTPPGAPAPMMKSLAQIEPRTPISSAPFTITQPGSYYLTTNLNVTGGDAIDIDTNQVTLDLNGFTISSTAASTAGTAIYLAIPANNNDIAIFNGHIVSGVTNNGTTFGGPGFSNGVVIISNANLVQNVRVTGVTVSGCEANGIELGIGDGTIIESCVVQNCGMNGIAAQTVSRSTASQCGGAGIVATIASDCSGSVIASGFFGVLTTIANNCYGYAAGAGHGINCVTANNCYGLCGGSGTGLSVTGSAMGSFGQSVSGIGIQANIANSCTVGGGSTSITKSYNE